MSVNHRLIILVAASELVGLSACGSDEPVSDLTDAGVRAASSEVPAVDDTLQEGCDATAAACLDVATSTINRCPLFTGVDHGSTDVTARVCAPGFTLTVSGSLTRDHAQAVAELAAARS